MLKSQSTWNQHFNFRSVLDSGIITLYVGHGTKCRRKQHNEKHGVNITELWFFEKMKKLHNLKHQYVSKDIKVGVLWHHNNLW
jgi:hypothetical protein